VKNTARRPRITVSADGSGIISQTGAVLLTKTLQVTGRRACHQAVPWMTRRFRSPLA
jgi:hypothetical protein